MTADNSSEILEKKIGKKIDEMEFRTTKKIDGMYKKVITRVRILQLLITIFLVLAIIKLWMI